MDKRLPVFFRVIKFSGKQNVKVEVFAVLVGDLQSFDFTLKRTTGPPSD